MIGRAAAIGGITLAVTVAACARSDGAAPRRELLVSAAASLVDAFAAVERAFEAAHPDVDVVLNLAGSSALRDQIIGGAPADLFAAAGLIPMSQVVEAGRTAGETRVFARNRLQIAVPAGNPAGVSSLEDFADEELLMGLCAETVPCGGYAREALAKAGVTPALDTNEPNVGALLTKIEEGELDAGITYVTDVITARGRVEGIDIPEDLNVEAVYPIAVLDRAPNEEQAAAFVTFVLSPEGQEILRRFGFDPP